MKRLLLILILTFSFQALSKADDIRDFEIEGMSIGDSLLDFITISKIKTLRTSYYPKSKKYVRYYEVKNSTQYDGVDLYVLDKDKKFIIQSLSGFIEYDKNIKDCYLKKENIIKEVSSQLRMKGDSYISNYNNDTSKSDVTDFELQNGSIRVWCTDYSKKKEKLNFGDFFAVTVSSESFLNWLDNEAY